MSSIDNIIFEKVWQDMNCFEVRITCSSSSICATTHVYLTVERIDNLCSGLKLFCDNAIEIFEWMSGKLGDDTTACVLFTFSRKDALGHITIEIFMELDDEGSCGKHNCSFLVHTELGMLESFLKKLPYLSNEDNKGCKIMLGDKGTVLLSPPGQTQ